MADTAPVHRFGRTLSTIGLIGALLTVALVVALFEWHGQRAIRANEARHSTQLVQLLGQLLWLKHADYWQEAETLSRDALQSHPSQREVERTVRQAAQSLPVLSVKLYAPGDGRTLYAANIRQVGELRHSPLLTQALAGGRPGVVAWHDRVEGLRETLAQRHVYTTILPFRTVGTMASVNKPTLLVEVSTDVSAQVAAHEQGRWMLALGVLTALSLLGALVASAGRLAKRRLAASEATKREQAERLRQQAFVDALTSLPNRARFAELGARLKADKRSRNKAFGVMFIDLDRFKLVNDSMGMKVGDGVLQQVAERIRKALRDVDRVYRVGGDEFIAIINTDDLPTLDITAQRIVASISKRFLVHEADVSLSVSIGIARSVHDAATLDQVAACAELAMVAAKRAGANQHAMYRAEMKRELDDEIAMMAGLRSALDRNEFLLHYQPRLNSTNGAIETVEALLRWHHPTLGILPPGRFIRVLEDNPLIVDVGAWVIDTAAMQLAEWHRQGHRNLRVSVNVAARQFRHKGLVKTVHRALKETGIPPLALELEITEGQLVHDEDGAMQTLDRLKALGVRLSIDDFGTGYSSLAYLQKLPIDCIKIDRAFVKNLGTSSRQGNIARAIASMAHGLGLKVVAEGVETEAQAKLLRAWGCEELQGFLFSKPVPSRDIDNLLRVQRMDEERAAAEVKALVDAATSFDALATI